MYISGVVLTLDQNAETERDVRLRITDDHRCESGEQSGCRLPVVITADSDRESRAVFEWLRSLSGVNDIALAFAHFENPPQAAPCRLAGEVPCA